jgi:hypothetical protein
MKVKNLIQAVVAAAKEDKDGLGDDDVLTNKTAVSEYAYEKGLTADEAKQISLADITADASSVATVEAAVDTAAEAAEAAALAGETFSLTESAGLGEYTSIKDGGLFTGTDKDDTFLASAGQTENAIIMAGAGLDTLKATLDDTDDGVAPATTDVEVFKLRDTNGDTIDLVDATGLELVYSDRSSANLTLDNVSTAIQVGLKDTDKKLTVKYDAVTGDEDVALLRLDGSKDGAAFVATDSADAAAIETLKILVEDDSFVNTAGASDFTSVNVVSGTGSLDLKTLDTTTTTLTTEAAYTGDLSVIAANAIDTTITTGAGDDKVTANGDADLTVTTGAGDDTIDMLATLTVDDVIDGGEGNDTLKMTGSDDVLVDDLQVTNFENIEVTTDDDDVINLDNTTASNISFVSADSADTVKFDNVVAQTLTVTNTDNEGVNALGLATATVALKTTSGTTATEDAESATLNITNADENAVMKIDTVAIDGVENVTLNLTANKTIEALAGDDNVKEVEVGAITTNEIEVLTITGDAQDVVLGSDTALAMKTITSTATSNVTVSLGAAEQKVTLGAGDDKIIIAANSTKADIIDGGAGDDTMTATVASGVDAVSATTTNVETVEVAMALTEVDSTDVTDTFDASNITGATSLVLSATITDEDTSSAETNTYAITGLVSTTAVTLSGSFNDDDADVHTVSLALDDATGTTDTMTIKSTTDDGADTTIESILVSDVETISLNVTADKPNDTIDIVTISALAIDGTKTLNVTSEEDISITLSANDALTAINLSGAVEDVTLDLDTTGDDTGVAITLGNSTAVDIDTDITLNSGAAESDTIKVADTMVDAVKVTNFTAGSGITADKLDLSAYGITSTDDLSFTDTNGGADVVIDTATEDANFGSIYLVGVTTSDLDSANFIFAS